MFLGEGRISTKTSPRYKSGPQERKKKEERETRNLRGEGPTATRQESEHGDPRKQNEAMPLDLILGFKK